MGKNNFEIPNKIWKDKRIPTEAKYIYGYINTKGYNRFIIDINIGELQKYIKIKNKGLRKNLERLEQLKYLIYKEYSNGMYTIKLN